MNRMESSIPRQKNEVPQAAHLGALVQNALTEIKKTTPSLEEIAATTDTTYGAGRFAPRDYADLRAQATDAYDSGILRKEFYPPKRIKEWRKAPQKGFDWKDCRYTPEQMAAHRHRGILQAMYVARRGAALGYLPEVSWENIYVIDNVTMIGCHLMKGAILALPSCLEWTDEEILEKIPNGGERVIGYKMTVRRMLPSGNVQKTVVQCYMSEFAHLFEGEDGKLVWKQYGPDMIYAACVRRASNHSFPDRVRGMGTKEEFAVMRHASPNAETAPIATPNIDALLEDSMDIRPIEAPLPEPTQEPSAPATQADEATALLKDIQFAGEQSDWEGLEKRAKAFVGTEWHAALQNAWKSNAAAPKGRKGDAS